MKSETFDKEQFLELYAKLGSAMAELNQIDAAYITSLVRDFCVMFRLCKGIIYLYDNPEQEAQGKGEIQCCYDTGEEGVPVISHRVVTSVMSIAHMTVYMPPDQPPLTDVEREHCDLVMRTVMSFMSRNRLRVLVEKLAFTDERGYPNIRSLYNYLIYERGNVPIEDLVVMHYNLWHFALINQEIGRKNGDTVMRKHFEGVCRIVGKQGRGFHLGGDNFIVALSRECLPELLTYLTEAVVPYGEQDESAVVSCTAGIFCLPDGMVIRNMSDVMEKVIFASRAAQNGEERIVFYDDNLVRLRAKSMRLQQIFPEALRREEFCVYYQPKVDVETGELYGAEALCRWFHEGKMIMPGDFIPVLEQTTDICKLDFLMLELVCRNMSRWLLEGRSVVRISVNLSRKHMMDSHLLQSILEIIDRYHVPHELIEIELTETTTDVEFRDLKRVVGGLQREGIITSVDDFGVGYSSLNLLREIPWNVLKIDRSFLPQDDESPDSPASTMFRHVVALAKELGLECITEGVETRRQVEILRENGCALAQGYYFDRPLPVDEFEKRMDHHHYADGM